MLEGDISGTKGGGGGGYDLTLTRPILQQLACFINAEGKRKALSREEKRKDPLQSEKKKVWLGA